LSLFTWSALAAWTTTWGVVANRCWNASKHLEDIASPEFRKATSDWLARLDAGSSLETIAQAFAGAFDRVFGSRHLSWKCFGRSCAASYLFATLLVLIAIFVYGRTPVDGVVGFVVITAVLNVIPDYFSLLKSRYIIRKLTTTRSQSAGVLLVVLDALGSGLIGFLSVIVLATSFYWVVGKVFSGFLDVTAGPSDARPDIIVALSEAVSNLDVGALFRLQPTFDMDLPAGVWLYATFMTSVWGFLYVMSGVIIRRASRLAGPINRAIGAWKWSFDITAKPFLAIGMMLNGLIGICYAVGCLFLLLS